MDHRLLALLAVAVPLALTASCRETKKYEPKPPAATPAVPPSSPPPVRDVAATPGSAAATAASAPAGGAAPPAAPSGGGLAALGPISGPTDDATVIRIAGVSAPKPVEWTWVQPTMQFRNLQYAVPAPGGQGEAAELIISVFPGGDGGPIEPNITRWAGQFRTEANEAATPIRSQRTQDGLTIHLVELKGRYQGMGAPAARPNIAQLAAIVESPGANVFIRLLGPDATVEANRAAWNALIDGMKKG